MQRLKDIKALHAEAMQDARAYVDSLAKPLGALGALEDYAVRLAGIRGYRGCPFRSSGVLVFAADNGVHDEGITTVPAEVTALQAASIARGVAGVNAMGAQLGTQAFVYDVGVKADPGEPAITNVNVMRGTDDIAKGPAMTREACEQAIKTGFDAATDHSECDVLGVGEMGICNTTTASAVLSVLLSCDPAEVTGRGAGVDDAGLQKKIDVIRRAIEVNQPQSSDVVDVLAKVGGLDIAAMTGAFLGAAYTATPVVVDGFISVVAAVCAVRLCENARGYMFLSHKSAEPGYVRASELLNMRPALDLDMRLGEGSGCPLMFGILNAALYMVENMTTLDAGGVDKGDLVDIRK